MAAIRRLPLEGRRRTREDKGATWIRMRDQLNQNAETATTLVNIPVRILNYWR